MAALAGSPLGAYCGHKEAIRALPRHAVALATSPVCPVQAFRIGSRVYAMQFHLELDLAGLATRIQIFRHAGYFPPDQADAVLAAARASGVTRTPDLLARFVELFCAYLIPLGERHSCPTERDGAHVRPGDHGADRAPTLSVAMEKSPLVAS